MRFEDTYSWSLDKELEEREVIFKSIYKKAPLCIWKSRSLFSLTTLFRILY